MDLETPAATRPAAPSAQTAPARRTRYDGPLSLREEEALQKRIDAHVAASNAFIVRHGSFGEEFSTL
jgi:hypothetical protein